jgi:hypothetical protein
MDPYIESQRFDEFHSVYLVTLAELLVPLVRPKYVVDVERYVFLSAEDDEQSYKPDVAISEGRDGGVPATGRERVATLEPRMLSVPMPDEHAQKFLVIRSRDDRRVVTMIEVLSPVNKSASGGQREYLSKRTNYLQTLASLVEIDLLRGGTRLPSKPLLTDGDYSACVIRHGDSTHVAAYTWDLDQRLPVIPVPLGEGDPDVGLDLQAAFDRTYDRRGYDYILDYAATVKPPVTADVQQWIVGRLPGAKS